METFLKFKGKLKAYENILLVEEALKGLTEVEAVFLRLAWFFEAPEYESFHKQGDGSFVALKINRIWKIL